MARNKVWRYTTAQRQKILDTAKREKLSGAQIAKRFGISMWTYYSWRSPARDIHVKKKRNGKAGVRSNKAVAVTKRGRRTGNRYSAADKKRILDAARRDGLSGAQVQKRFGISPLTYYRWNGPLIGPKAKLGRPRANGAAGVDDIRETVRARVQAVLPGIIREQVDAYVTEILGGKRGPGRPRTRF